MVNHLLEFSNRLLRIMYNTQTREKYKADYVTVFKRIEFRMIYYSLHASQFTTYPSVNPHFHGVKHILNLVPVVVL